ncbi:hypothetical protein [Paracoccus pacificus]|uniref:Sugar lactone lactonase YvrE n=1 Tax=Paracoccus pacificus TaxID=1463598 RepID=A0ABW4RC92_9RHOB
MTRSIPIPAIPIPGGAALMTTAAILIGAAAAASADQPAKLAFVIDGLQSPESVLMVGERRFVSNIGKVLDPSARDADGYIAEYAADGRLVAERAFPPAGETLNAPKGMAAIDGRLFVTDIDRVLGFDIASGKRVFDQPLPGGEIVGANDLAATGDGKLIISDTERGIVYRLDPDSGQFTEIAADIPGANGIAIDPRDQKILVAGVGRNFAGGDVYALEPGGPSKRLKNAPHGILDGLAVLPDGRAIVSDWVAVDRPVPGNLDLIPVDGAAAGAIQTGRDIAGPADFALDSAGGTLWVPAMLSNQIVVLKIGE